MGDVAQRFDRGVLAAGDQLLAGLEALTDQRGHRAAGRAVVHAEEDVDVALVARQAVFGERLRLHRVPVLGVLLADHLDLARGDQRLEELVLAGLVLPRAVLALVALDARDLDRRLAHLAD